MSLEYRKSALLLCTALFASAAGVQAQDTEALSSGNGTTQLKEIVVKGKRSVAASEITNSPLATQTTADEIRKKDISNIRDLGNTTEPGVEFVESRPGAAGGTFIRGLGGARITTLVDDIPVPFIETQARSGSSSPATDFSDSTNSFDFSSLSAVDVLRGSDSSRVGPGALAGAIVVKTLEPEDLIEEGRDWGGIAKIGYDSQDKSYNGSVAVAKKIENTSVLFQTGLKRGDERRNQGDLDVFGSNRTATNPADASQNNLLFKLRQDLGEGHKIGFTAERFFSNSDIDMKTLQAGSYLPGMYSGVDDTKRERVSLDYVYQATSDDALIDSAKATLYWQSLEKDAGAFATRTSGGRSWQYDRMNMAQESSFGFTGGLVSEFETDVVNHSVRIGGNVNVFKYEEYLHSIGGTSATPANGSQSDVPNIDGVRVGIYAEDELSFAGTGFSLTPGVRLDWHDYNPKDSDGFQQNTGYAFGLPKSSNDFRISPKILAKYDVTENFGVFAQWSMSYRAPTVAELYSNFSNLAHRYARRGNDSLEAETGQGIEAGVEYQSGGLTARATAYHNRYKNFIADETINPYTLPGGATGMLFTQVNLNAAAISGVELKVRNEFDNGFFVHGSLAYAYAYGKDKENDLTLRTVSPLKSVVGVGYAQEQWGTELTGLFASGMRDDNDADTFDAPGYGIFNISGWWEPEQVKGLRVQVGVYNLFDKTYYNAVGLRDINPNSATATNQPVEFYSEPGRTFKISLTQKF